MAKGLSKSITAMHEVVSKKAAETNFTCAVCDKRRPLVQDGADNFFTARNEGKVCLACVRARDVTAFEAGRITMRLEDRPAPKGWCAVSLGGRMVFKLDKHPEGVVATLARPSFVDRQGRHWKGRAYPGGNTAHFQRKSKGNGVAPSLSRVVSKQSTAG